MNFFLQQAADSNSKKGFKNQASQQTFSLPCFDRALGCLLLFSDHSKELARTLDQKIDCLMQLRINTLLMLGSKVRVNFRAKYQHQKKQTSSKKNSIVTFSSLQKNKHQCPLALVHSYLDYIV